MQRFGSEYLELAAEADLGGCMWFPCCVDDALCLDADFPFPGQRGLGNAVDSMPHWGFQSA